jgi:predicted acyl esterase
MAFNPTKTVNPESIRTVNPSTWPQYPYDDVPTTPEQSPVRYSIYAETDKRLRMRDGTHLAYDVFRPHSSGEKFPALVAVSPYTRQLQHTLTPIGQNEAGLTEFWVPRGYAHVIVDVRGTNDSEGEWDMFGPEEQRDVVEMIEHIAQQPWCNGRVGMTGCSYFARSQNFAAALQPPSLKATFPYDANTDLYRDAFYHGGIPSEGFQRIWASDVIYLNYWGGRRKSVKGFDHHFQTVIGGFKPYDCEYYQERSAWPRLADIKTPSYFGCDWRFVDLHLRGTFEAFNGTPGIPKRALLGPLPQPRRPFANYHMEALRWYDAWLKDMDTRVLDGDPIQIFVQGDDRWRAEKEWPLARTKWTEYFLGGSGSEGILDDGPPADGGLTYEVRPLDLSWLRGEPRLKFRSAPVERDLEVTGPIKLTLWASTTATDTDWLVWFYDEYPDGRRDMLTKGWLRSSHRALDRARSKPWQPWHPHTEETLLPVLPNSPIEHEIEVLPTCNVFKQGHRMCLEIASSDAMHTGGLWYNRCLPMPADNTVLVGRAHPSRLLLPVIPR